MTVAEFVKQMTEDLKSFQSDVEYGKWPDLDENSQMNKSEWFEQFIFFIEEQ